MKLVQVWNCIPGNTAPIDVSEEWTGLEINEIAKKLPAGVYTTLRTYGHSRTLYLERHFDRLVESSRILGFQLEIGGFHLREKMRIAILSSGFSEIRIRIHIPLIKKRAEAFLLLEELTLPSPKAYRNGVEVASRMMKREHAEAKFTGFIRSADEIRKELPSTITEVVMVGSPGIYLEGLSSNFYVVENGRIWTAQEGVLHGITRDIVLEILADHQFPVVLQGFPLERSSEINEAFLTSTSRGVLPVVAIDGKAIGNQCPGPITARIRALFEEKIGDLLEDI